jgi:hypothetical protein
MGFKHNKRKEEKQLDREIIEFERDVKFDRDDILGERDEVNELNDFNNFDNNCVCDVVRAIADAQENAIEVQCDVSCSKSIQNLVSPVRENDLDTVPFILYCEGTCKPFKAFGADVQMDGQPRFDCIESFIFRVSEVDDDCCARLELLTFGGDPQQPGDQKGAKWDKDPCDQLNGKKVRDLQGTGVCITVDLNDFAAITCLPAVDLF